MHRSRRLFAQSMFASALFLASSVAPTLAAGSTIYVDNDGKGSSTGCAGNHPIPSSIQAAVNSAGPGTLILVCPGTYVENVMVSTSNITIRGVKPFQASIVAPPTQNANGPVVYALNAAHFVIRWMNVLVPTTGNCVGVGGVISINASANSRVLSNHIGILGDQGLGPCRYESGVRVVGHSDGTKVMWNRITDFEFAGIDLDDSANLVIRKNKVRYFHAATESTSSSGAGILLNESGAGTRISGNTIRGLASGGISTPRLAVGIQDNTMPALIQYNRFHNMDTGIILLSGSAGHIYANTIFSGVGTAIAAYYGSGEEVNGNDTSGASNGMYENSGRSGDNIHDNDFNGAGQDCQDDSTGTGTAGTANTWTNDFGDTSNPSGLCGTN